MHRSLLLHFCSIICLTKRFSDTTNTNSKGCMLYTRNINVRYKSSIPSVDEDSNISRNSFDDGANDDIKGNTTNLKEEHKELIDNNNFAFHDVKVKSKLEPESNDVIDVYSELQEVSENDYNELCEYAQQSVLNTNVDNNNNTDQDELYISGLERETRVNQLPEIDDQYDLYNESKLNSESTVNNFNNSTNENFWWLRDKVLVNDIPRRLPRLRIPDKEGVVVEEEEEKQNLSENSIGSNMYTEADDDQESKLEKHLEEVEDEYVKLPMCHPINRHSYLTQQDLLYLSYPTSPEVQMGSLFNDSTALLKASTSTFQAEATNTKTRTQIFALKYNSVLVVFTANDLRVHDNYALAMASAFIQEHLNNSNSGSTSTNTSISIIGVCVIDYRTFAQPSRVGGFYRQGPDKARFLLHSIAALRGKLEREWHIPLLIRCGRPEEHIPRLSLELNALAVFMSTQYFPHERRVQEQIIARLRGRVWVSKALPSSTQLTGHASTSEEKLQETNLVSREHKEDNHCNEQGLTLVKAEVNTNEPFVLETHEHVNEHPYGPEYLHQLNMKLFYRSTTGSSSSKRPKDVHDTHLAWLTWCMHHPLQVHTIWQSTLVHLDDLPTPLHLMQDGERWYHDAVNIATIRRTNAYDSQIARITSFPFYNSEDVCSLASLLLPSPEELQGTNPPSLLRGRIPTLEELGYGELTSLFQFTEAVGTTQNFFSIGEDAALARMQEWMNQGGFTSFLRYGRERRTNMKMYSIHLSRLSPYLSLGVLSPRKVYEELRRFAQSMSRDGFAQMQFREALLRLSRRDYWHWMGLRVGDRLFYPYGPSPLATDHIPPWRHDRPIIQKWCMGLTGIPFADASMKELRCTGFVGFEGRKALAWLLCVGYNQDWRVGAEWFARNLLDYDPLVCYGNFAYYTTLTQDDYGEDVFDVHHIAHHHDQTGIYVKKWLPVLSKVPPVYIHRPHVLTKRMQAMHNVYLGQNYPYPIKLWDGAQNTLGPHHLTCYVGSSLNTHGPGYAEAFRHSQSLLDPAEWEAFALPIPVDLTDKEEEEEEEEKEDEVHALESSAVSSWMDLYLPSSAFESDERDDENAKRTVPAKRQVKSMVDNVKVLPEVASESSVHLLAGKENISVAG